MQRICRLKSARIESELRLAKRYWLVTVQPFIAGRQLCGAELYVARHAYYNLVREADRNGREWNVGGRHLVLDSGNAVIVKDNPGRDCPIPEDALVKWQDPLFAEPEPLYADDLKPEPLASLAASLLPKSKTRLSADEAIRRAHNLLLAAERYVAGLPKRPLPGENTKEWAKAVFNTVTFDEIMASNEKNSGRLPLLFKLVKRQDKESRELLPLSLDGIRKAIKQFKEGQQLHATEADYNRNLERDNSRRAERGLPPECKTYEEWQAEQQQEIADHLKNRRIMPHELAEMRWKRFRDFSEKQRRPTSPTLKRGN